MNTTLFNEDTDPYLIAVTPPLVAQPHSQPQPQPHPSFPPDRWMPANAVMVTRQEWRDEWTSQTYWTGFGDVHCIATVSTEAFLLFLNQIRYPVIGYRESSFAPWVTRRRLVSKLLREGYVCIFRVGDVRGGNGLYAHDAVYYLVPISAVPAEMHALNALTCLDLHNERQWDASLCCVECHSDTRLFTEICDTDTPQKRFTSKGGPVGRIAHVCCRAHSLLPTYSPLRRYRPEELPIHETP